MRILIANEKADARRSLAEKLGRLGLTPDVVTSRNAARRRLATEEFDLVFVGSAGLEPDGLPILPPVRADRPAPLVVLVETGASDVDAPSRKAPAFARIDPGTDTNRLRRLLLRAEKVLPPASRSLSASPGPADRLPSRPTLRPHGRSTLPRPLGFGRLDVGPPGAAPSGVLPERTLRIDATGARPSLVGRLLVGSYITGHDRVLLTARDGVTAAQRAVVHRTADRMLGMTVVNDSDGVLEVQNFVDPARYDLPRLLQQVVRILHHELELCRRALVDDASSAFESLEPMEEEVDRLYLLMARQILLSSDSPRLAHRVDLESHHYQLGYRLVAKVLEVTGDLVFGVAQELVRHLAGFRRLSPSIRKELARRLGMVDDALLRTTGAFARLSAKEADSTLNRLSRDLVRDCATDSALLHRIPDRRLTVSAQCIVGNLGMALEMMVIINETTINRCVEPETVARASLPPSAERPPAPPRPKTVRLRRSSVRAGVGPGDSTAVPAGT
jgi:phosphate uptake regulator/CheY-like chemotaxis protein